MTIVGELMLHMVAFLAGLAARTKTGRTVTNWVEQPFLGNMPRYRVVTSMADGLNGVDFSPVKEG